MREAFRLARAWTGTLPRRAVSLVGTVARRGGRTAVALGASTVAAALAAVVVGVFGAPNPAGATLPGENGRLLIEGSRGGRHSDIFAVDPEGSDEQREAPQQHSQAVRALVVVRYVVA
jgi:hypothetical protein